MSDFVKGMQVVSNHFGTGIIKHIDRNIRFAVEFDKEFNSCGDCGGKTRDKRGHWYWMDGDTGDFSYDRVIPVIPVSGIGLFRVAMMWMRKKIILLAEENDDLRKRLSKYESIIESDKKQLNELRMQFERKEASDGKI
jgi:hypothetical protein